MATHELPSQMPPEQRYTHPYEQECLKDPLVRELVDFLDRADDTEWATTHPNGEMVDDDTFRFEEGMVIRRPVEIKAVVDYLREKGLLNPQSSV